MAEAKGEVTYEIRADDSKLESDLDAAQKKVEKSERENGEKREAIEGKTSEGLKKEKEGVTDHHKKQNDVIVKDDGKTGEEREENERKVSDNIKKIAGSTAKAIGVGMMAVGTAAVAVGGMAVNSANNMDKAMNQFAASTGKSIEETGRYQKVLEEIYKNNYGESFEDIGEAMADVTRQLGDMSDDRLQEVTESAFALRDTFGYEIPESTRAAKAMMDNFGITGEKAMELIAAGAQNNLDYSGELIDSINEYSVQFAKVGLDADDMFKIFEKGAETGAWNLDKIGDAIKEMSIRVIDGSETTKEGFEAIGLNADEMAEKFAAGGDSAREAFQQTIEALAGMEDPLAQNTAGVNLFGTMWEDLGPEVVTQLASIKEGAYDMAGAMDQIKEVKYDDLGSMFEGLKRSVEMLLLPLGEQLIPVLDELIESALPLLEDALPPIIDVFGELVSQLAPLIEENLPLLLELIDALIEPLLDILESILPVSVGLLQELLPPLVSLVETLLPVVLSILDTLIPIIETLAEALAPVLELFLGLLAPLLELIELALTPLLEIFGFLVELLLESVTPTIEALLVVFTKVFDAIAKAVKVNFDSVMKIFKEVLEFIKNIFTKNWKEAWENVKNIFKAIAESLAEVFKIPINWIIDKINSFIDGLNKIQIPDWVPGLGGKGFNIPHIPKLRVGMDFVPEDDFPALLHRGEAVLTAEENSMLRSIGGIGALYSALNSPSMERSNAVTVENMASAEPTDYERLGEAFAEALLEGNVHLTIEGRDFARLERDYL